MTRAPRRAALAAAALAALGACSWLQRSPQPATSEGEWAERRFAETRQFFLYDGLNHLATATATHLSLSVREARARRLAEWLGWTQAELDARLAAERKEAAQGEEFFLSFYTADPLANDLDAPRPTWRVAVKLDGGDLVPTRLTSIDKNANDRTLFPYIGPFDVSYRVMFPPAPGGPLEGRKYVLEIASALGKLPLDYGALPEPLKPAGPVPPP